MDINQKAILTLLGLTYLQACEEALTVLINTSTRHLSCVHEP